MQTLIAPFINLIALLAILGFYLRKPLADLVVSRHVSLRDGLLGAREALRAAQESVSSLSERIKGMDAELAALRAQAREDGEKIRNSILVSAKSLSAAILADARSSAASAQSEFRASLRRELAGMALSRAEVRLRDRLTGEDHARIRREFSTLVEKTQ